MEKCIRPIKYKPEKCWVNEWIQRQVLKFTNLTYKQFSIWCKSIKNNVMTSCKGKKHGVLIFGFRKFICFPLTSLQLQTECFIITLDNKRGGISYLIGYYVNGYYQLFNIKQFISEKL